MNYNPYPKVFNSAHTESSDKKETVILEQRMELDTRFQNLAITGSMSKVRAAAISRRSIPSKLTEGANRS